MFNKLSIRGGVMALAALAVGSLYGCSKFESQDVKPATSASDSKLASGAQQQEAAGVEDWKAFLQRVEAGSQQDPRKQYVSKSTWVDNGGNGARPTRPKGDDTKRTLNSLFSLPSGPGAGTNRIAQDPSDGGGGGGGGSVPNYSNFSSTETVQPWNVTNASLKQADQANLKTGPVTTANVFYSTDNPNGYVYDLKIVKGPNDRRPPFHDNYHYHNIPIDLNEGAGGSYIYISFTRDPAYVEYNAYSPCDQNGNERPYVNGAYVDSPITQIDTQVNCCTGLFDKCQGTYRPLYCASDFYIGSDFMRVPDLNDGAGGAYIYAFQSRDLSYRPIEVGVVTGNNVNIQPPAGWTRVGSDLNKGAGGSYIFLCTKAR